MSDSLQSVPYVGEHSEDDLELFGPFRMLCPIKVEGRDFLVPEQISVLRACQYIEMKERAVRMPWKDYCWNNTDGCCEMTYREHSSGPVLVARGCITAAKAGMEIVHLPRGGRSCKPRR